MDYGCSRGRKYVILSVVLMLIFGAIGFVIGQFIRIPALKATGDDSGTLISTDPSLPVDGPLWVAINPEETSVNKSWLKVVTKDSNPFTVCPDGWARAFSFSEENPFYLKHEALEVKRDKIIAQVRGPLKKNITEVSRNNPDIVYGHDWEYELDRVEPSAVTSGIIFAKSTTATSKGRPTPKYIYGQQEFGKSWFFKESDLVGPLRSWSPLHTMPEVTLCTTGSVN